MKLMLGDCLQKLTEIPDNSVDSIVTDPPYGLSFMGKAWDYDVPGQNIWEECLRVLKPGGHLLAFFGTRTYHRGVIKIEDAGFEIRDQIMWIYGSGFPKSTDVSKRIDKEAGAEREVVGINEDYLRRKPNGMKTSGANSYNYSQTQHDTDARITAPSTPGAIKWQGWGTALKPANEPIVVARKPLEKGLTVAANVLKWGTGALNINGSRIDLLEGETTHGSGKSQSSNPNTTFGDMGEKRVGVPNIKSTQGRWPANIMFDEEAAATLPNDSQGESVQRYFYVAKASKSERNAGLEGVEKAQSLKENFHPTVKPIKLMGYLINLVTPPNGIVLDPFMGSGSTGVAAKNLGRGFVGIEMNEEYFKIAKKRIESAVRPADLDITV